MKKNTLISSALQTAMGLMLILWPHATLRTSVRLISLGALLLGAVGIYTFFSYRLRSTEAVLKLLGGIALAAAGLYGLMHTLRVERRLPLLLGAALMITAVYRAVLAARDKRDSTTLPVCALAFVIGLVIALNPFRSVRLFSVAAGLALLYNAFSGWWVKR